MGDPFKSYANSLEGPARHAAEITPSDGNDLETIPRALWIGGEGNLHVTMEGGEVVTFRSVVGILPIRVSRVHGAGTTATDIVAIW